MFHLQLSVRFFIFLPVMNSHSDASLCITMEKRAQHRGGTRGRPRGSKGFGTDKLHKWTNLPPFFFFSFFALLSLLSFPPRPPRRFCPRCWSWITVTLWQLPAPSVYSAQLEWRLVSYTTHAHLSFPPSKTSAFLKNPSACQLAYWDGGG